MYKVEVVKKMSQELFSDFIQLLPQLSCDRHIADYEKFCEIVNSTYAKIYIVRENMRILGMLTLLVYQIPTGKVGRIEDVIVDENFRGQGIGMMLCQKAIKDAINAGVNEIDLTSNPSRKAAHHLYKSLGFEIHDTTVFRYRMDD